MIGALIPEEMAGRRLLVADVVGTVALLAVTVASALSTATAVAIAGLVVATSLFLGGCLTFFVGFARAVGRSRTETVELAALFYLTGSAPEPVRRAFLRTWFAQMAIAVAAIAVSRPPFSVMAPLWGIGLTTLWASRHATFAPRDDAPTRPGGRAG
jgi:hypothetical protein